MTRIRIGTRIKNFCRKALSHNKLILFCHGEKVLECINLHNCSANKLILQLGYQSQSGVQLETKQNTVLLYKIKKL